MGLSTWPVGKSLLGYDVLAYGFFAQSRTVKSSKPVVDIFRQGRGVGPYFKCREL